MADSEDEALLDGDALMMTRRDDDARVSPSRLRDVRSSEVDGFDAMDDDRRPHRVMAPPRNLQQRQKERSLDRYDRFYEDYPPDEPFKWSDAGGLICGLILLVFIICVLTWAYLEDLKDARLAEESRTRGEEL
mmetsp:Transcript_30333/g.48589  ORF Transcript_30333/g.48589 Transcript_30333/m.48589 type:complete len:133 (-) Transcript_30333:116-514(-)